MRHMFRAFVYVSVLGASGVFLVHNACAAEPLDPRLEKVLADWQKRQGRVQAIEYQVDGEYKVPKGSYTKLAMAIGGGRERIVPSDDVTAPVNFKVLLDFTKGRLRLESKEQGFDLDSGKLMPQVQIFTFDGTLMRGFMPREKNPVLGPTQPEMTIVKGETKNGAFRSNYYPVFFAHGAIYTDMEQIVPGKLKRKTDPSYLHVHGTGVHDNRKCLILRTQALKMSAVSFAEYWVDMERESAIVRFTTYSNDRPTCDIPIRYRESSKGWLPDSWRWTIFDKGETLYFEKMRVTKCKINPAVTDADFDLEVKPGMIVEERTDHATKHPLEAPKSDISIYRSKEGGEREPLPDPYRRSGDQYEGQHHRQFWWWLGALTVGFGIVAFIGWTRYHRRIE